MARRPAARAWCRRAADREQQERRPHEVELLLDAQRPVVEQGRRREVGLQIVRRLQGEADVGREQRRPDAIDRDVRHPNRREHERRRDQRGDEDQDRGRQNAAAATGVEGRQGDATRRLRLPQQQPGDEEAREDEEHVDADVAAGKPGHRRVVEQHRYHRQPAQPLDVGPERARPVASRPAGGGSGSRSEHGAAQGPDSSRPGARAKAPRCLADTGNPQMDTEGHRWTRSPAPPRNDHQPRPAHQPRTEAW